MESSGQAARADRARVLVIDDDEMISVALYERLLAGGILVDRAVEPAAAIAALRSASYDVVVVDAYLTGQLQRGAVELLETIRSAQPLARVVVLTAYGSAELFGAIRSGSITVLNKPQPVAEIARMVAALLEKPAASS